ncbi:MAG: hypothetical protein ACRD3F_08235 [Acidobacteriaceae bacterium]
MTSSIDRAAASTLKEAMMRRFHFRLFYWIVLAGVMGCLPVMAQQQQQANPNAPPPAPRAPSSQPEKNCSWNAKKGSGTPWKGSSNCEPAPQAQDTNPFPEAKSQKAADTSSAPRTGEADQHRPPPAESNPFPEEKSRKAADAANPPANSHSSSSSSHFDLNRLNAPAGSEARISNGEGGYIHDPALAKKDEKVGNFYLSAHNYKGAYDRFLEATRVAPEDGNAVFGLAESARGLHKMQEAIANYSVYLQAFPNGKKAKDAEKALAELTPPRKK